MESVLDVICTVKDASETLVPVLESVVEQSFEDWYLWLVDDGSMDRTGEILDHFGRADQRIHVIRTEGVGRAAALNLALHQGSAPFVANVDGDDPCHRRRFELQLSTFPEGLACIGTDVLILRGLEAPNWIPLAGATRVEDVTGSLAYYNPLFHCSAMMRREAMVTIGGYDESRKRAVDYDLWVRLLENGRRIGVLRSPLVAKRTHEGQSFERSDRWSTFGSAARIQVRAIKATRSSFVPWLALGGRFLATALPSSLRKRIRLLLARCKA